jgi:AcrR family transcriptional regulator
MSAALGLRARKKQATRLALSRAAVRLAMERGLERVRVEDIATAAGVSLRTFNNYFASKEEAFVYLALERADQIGATLCDLPPTEPLAAALTEAFNAHYSNAGDFNPEWAEQLRLVLSAPALRAAYLKTLVATERSLAEAIAERTGADADHDLYPRVLAAAVSSAVRVAITHWLKTGATQPLATVVQQAISYVAGGPVPAPKEGAL